jgi:adenylate cyclase
MSFLTELRRRKVFRVAAVYAAMAFVVLQAADIMLPRLGVPEWAMSLIVVLVVLGFPVAVVLAWALELTPDGVRVTPAAPAASHGTDPGPSLLGRRTVALTAGLVLLGLGLGAGWVLKPAATEAPPTAATAPEPPEDRRSVAVLPFDDLSSTGDQEWFSDGLTEEILNSLARLGELRVSARNSSFQFKNRAVDVREVGERLGVASVLEGSVRRAGDQLRITAQLVRASDGFHLWSQTYDRHLDDVFAVQLDIAENIARVLDVFLDDARRERMEASGTRDPAAYLHYLRGRAEYEAAHAQGLDTNDRLWEANAWFDRALAADPAYALARFFHHDAFAHAVMGDITVPAALHRPDGSLDTERIERLMHADLDRAMADAGDGPLGRSLALVRHFMRGDWDRLSSSVAAFDLEAAAGGIEVAGRGFLWYPVMIMRELELGRELDRWLVERNPLDAGLWSQVIDDELRAGNVEEAERLLGRALEMGLEHRFLDESLVRILIVRGRAGDVLTTELPRFQGSHLAAWAAAMAHAELGQLDLARAALEQGELRGERRCWLLARIGDQVAANACATAIDAEPLGWVRLARVIVDDRSVPFDPEAAPRFTARYRASGAPPWPRTEAVSP